MTLPSHRRTSIPRPAHEEAPLKARTLAEYIQRELHLALGCRPGDLLDLHLKNADEAAGRLQRAVNVARGEAHG